MERDCKVFDDREYRLDLQRRELREVGKSVVGENADAIIAQIETR